MKNRARILLLGVALVLAGGVGVGWRMSQAAPRVWWLPDQTMLALEGITYGQRHQITHGTWWQKLVLPILPAQVRPQFERRFGCAVVTHTTAKPNTLVLWSFRRGSWQGVFRHTRTVVFDDQGQEYETGGRGRPILVSPPPLLVVSPASLRSPTFAPVFPASLGSPTFASVVEAIEVPVFSRRRKTLGVRVYHRAPGGAWNRVAECVLPNPAYGSAAGAPVWSPEPLPVTRREGSLAFTMTELRTGLPNKAIPRRAAVREAAWTRATFRVAEAGRPAPWEPVGVEIGDATGNVWTPRTGFADRKKDEAQFYFVGVPWTEELAWKLYVEFARTAGFAPADIWTVRGIPVPGLGRHHKTLQSATKHGVTISGVSLFVPPRTVPDAGGRKGVPWAMLMLSCPLRGVRLTLLRATDESGREFPTSDLVQTHTDLEYEAEVRIPPGVKSVNLTFALHKTRSATFLIAPPVVGVAGGATIQDSHSTRAPS